MNTNNSIVWFLLHNSIPNHRFCVIVENREHHINRYYMRILTCLMVNLINTKIFCNKLLFCHWQCSASACLKGTKLNEMIMIMPKYFSAICCTIVSALTPIYIKIQDTFKISLIGGQEQNI